MIQQETCFHLNSNTEEFCAPRTTKGPNLNSLGISNKPKTLNHNFPRGALQSVQHTTPSVLKPSAQMRESSPPKKFNREKL